ncbi:unnamed protein product [Didymodactylos carnosus]|uniref:Uncharacterized protein n=1 Tax=Didymodactylos carnosus TaxID=1234261 RepID=A0A813VFS8_9BILA|nr:unnamed protein product [Didymodactylos carnosus]CAF1175000.1 unnamed protein product [Didymodactylos carnosus]CAF3630072.1 unnamed protein product [Didymodactylos carnosus]CAF3986201.1 unnamed protein product [Didymodactylos carnosus]
MGCGSLANQPECSISAKNRFTQKDIQILRETWTIIKTHYDMKKLGDDIMNRTLQKLPLVESFWRNSVIVEGNNLNFGEYDSCLKTDMSWKLEFQNHGLKLLRKLDEVLLLINDDTLLKNTIKQITNIHLKNEVNAEHYTVRSTVS